MEDMRNPHRILFSLWQRRKIGSFYIIRPPILSHHDSRADLKTWLNSFFMDIIAQEKNCDAKKAKELMELGVSDFYIIEKDEGDREYKIHSNAVSEFVKAHNYPPLEFSYKFIVVWDAEDLSTQISNKWLKTLEEPQENIITLFLTTSNRPLLSTIESRAITLRLAPNKETWNINSSENFLDFLGNQVEQRVFWKEEANEKQKQTLLDFAGNMTQVHKILDQLKYSQPLSKEVFELCHNYVTFNCREPRLMELWLKEIQWFEKANTFNNAPGERFLGLFHVIQQIDGHHTA